MKTTALAFTLTLMISVFTLASTVDGLQPDRDDDLIMSIMFDESVRQYDHVGITLLMNNSLELDDITLILNTESWVRGIPPISEQLPYAIIPETSRYDMTNSTIILQLEMSDQMIWYNGEEMVDNITITVAAICFHNGTEDIEIFTVELIDVNDPPVINGKIRISPGEIHAGDTVEGFISDVEDPDLDPITLIWDLPGGGTEYGPSFSKVISTPGTYPLTLTATDGDLSVSKIATVEVLPVKGTNATPPEKGKEDDGEMEEEEQDTSLFRAIILILLILIMIVVALSLLAMARSKIEKEDEEPPRRLWSMSPMRGPSNYERESLRSRVKGLGAEKKPKSDDSELDEDISLWEKDWNFDPGF